MALDPELLEILACPNCKTQVTLVKNGTALKCAQCNRVYPIKDDQRFVLEFLHYSAPGAIKPFRARTMDEPGLTHLSIAVDDIYAAAQKAVEYGGEIIDDSDIGAAIFIRDPDGQLLELLPTGYRANLPPKP